VKDKCKQNLLAVKPLGTLNNDMHGACSNHLPIQVRNVNVNQLFITTSLYTK